MINDLVVNAILVAALGGGMTAGKFYGDHIYESQVTAKQKYAELEITIAAVSSAQQMSSNKQRILQLQGWIATTKRTAEGQNRLLTTAEKNRISEWQTEVDNLKGW
jgi:uncharacterized protein HemX